MAFATGGSFAQNTVNVFGASTPVVVDSGNPSSILLGVRVFSDVAGQVVGCTFYKASTNIGPHVVSLWDSAGKLLASQTTTTETDSGVQAVRFATPIPMAANQTFTCGYYTAHGHYSNDRNVFTVQKNVPPLHVPINGGVYLYGTSATAFPTTIYLASNYWVDVLFAPAGGSTSATWISGTSASATGSTANISWNTVVPSDSQVEYGSNTSYGSSTTLAATRVTAHSVAITGLSAGATYHFRVRSSDSDAISATGADHTLTTVAAVLPVSISTSPTTASIASGATQQFMAMVSNAANAAVTWSATAGTINASGLFTAPNVSAQTSVTVTAVSQADTTKSASAMLTVSPAAAISVSPTSLSFAGKTGTSSLTPASVSITNTGAGALTFTGVSDQSWLMLSPASGTAPSSLQVTPAITGMKAGTYTGHVTLTGGGVSKTVTVALSLTAPVVQHSVALSWKASTNTHVISYSMYRSTISGSSYGLSASAISGVAYSDASVQSGTTYYYVVTAVDDQGRESGYSNQITAIIP
ncbi:MAG: DUF4082 domain-containing protein [Terriglobales bacterium]